MKQGIVLCFQVTAGSQLQIILANSSLAQLSKQPTEPGLYAARREDLFKEEEEEVEEEKKENEKNT